MAGDEVGPVARMSSDDDTTADEVADAVFPDQTPISALTLMRCDVWKKWLSRSGYNRFDTGEGYGGLFPDRAQEILRGIEFGVTVDYEGDRTEKHSVRIHQFRMDLLRR